MTEKKKIDIGKALAVIFLIVFNVLPFVAFVIYLLVAPYVDFPSSQKTPTKTTTSCPANDYECQARQEYYDMIRDEEDDMYNNYSWY